jgi:hypothetical protein
MVVAGTPVMKQGPTGGQRGLGSVGLPHSWGSQPSFILIGQGLAVPPGIAVSCWRESNVP